MKNRLLSGVAVLLFPLCAAGATFTVTNTNDSGAGSLRQAILDANAASGGTVAFNIPTTPRTITPSSSLPLAEAGVIIDGTTQPGYLGSPVVEISGANIPNTGFQACVKTRGTVRGLSINRCSFAGIQTFGPAVISANYIGPSLSGFSFGTGNGTGIRLDSGSNGVVIGGSTFADGNVISGNSAGVASDFISNILISHNKIGTDSSGNGSFGNGSGLFLNDGSSITIDFNVIAANTIGIQTMLVSDMTINNNSIGVGASGNPLGNSSGISLFVTDTTTIGDLAGGGNIIANNFSAGITVLSDGAGHGTRNVIRGNSMYNNGIGVDLSANAFRDGQTANDSGDADIGGNTLQNYPVLTKVSSIGGSTSIVGTFNSVPNQSFTVDFYWSDAACNGRGEGKNYLGSLPLTTDPAGNATINTSFGVTTPQGGSLTAVAVDANGNTSEFSPCALIQGPGEFALSNQGTSFTEFAGNLTITIVRMRGAVGAVTVDYTTVSGSATAGSDFTATAGTLTFADGETVKTVNIPMLQDSVFEGTEEFSFKISNATGGATIGAPSSSTFTIFDDDPPPLISIADAQVTEGNSGTTPMNFTVTLSAPAVVPISFEWETLNGTASAFNDFQFVCCPTVTFNPGETSKTLTVNVFGDTLAEPNETFSVILFGLSNASFARSNATGTILNDDAPAVITVSGLQVTEGNSGTKIATVTLTSDKPLSGSISYSTADGTAQAGQDYVSIPFGTLFFSGQTTATINVTIIGDTNPEPNENFKIVFGSNSTGATLSSPVLVSILNDDAGFGPSGQSVPAGGKASFTLDLGAAAPPSLNVTFTTSNAGVLDVPAAVTVTGPSTTFEFPALATGSTLVSIALPAPYNTTFSANVTVFEAANFVLTPSAITIPEGTTLTLSAKFDPPLTSLTTVQLKIGDPSLLDVPSLITIGPGQTTTFAAKPLKRGSTVLIATLSSDHGNKQTSYFVDVVAPPTTPAVTQIIPANGPVAGGTEVAVNGANLVADCALFFGGVPAANVSFVSPTAMTATTPAHPGGTVDVTLICGSEAFVLANGFTYLSAAPAVASVAPSFGSIAGGTLVRIIGSNFRSGCWPLFDDVAAPTADFLSTTEMIGEAPPHAAGKAAVAIRCTDSADGVLAEAFTYSPAEEPSPQIDSVIPLAGAPGEPVTLSGIRFRRDDSVDLDGAAAAILSSSPDSDLIRIPALPPGNAAITLTGRSGHATTTGPIFTVLEAIPPRIDHAAPASFRPGTDVVLDGTGFRPGYSFAFGSNGAAVVSLAYTRVILRVPSIAPGAYRLNVLNAAGKVASVGPIVTVSASGPSINNIAPACSATTGGGTMIITGGGFEPGVAVTFDGTMATTKLVDSKTLNVTIPAGAVGAARIVITNPSGTSATLTGAFVYYSPFDPNGGCSGGRSRPSRH